MPPFSWNFPGAYPVIAAVGVSVSAAIYQVIRNVARNPDCRLTNELKTDEMAESEKLASRAASYRDNMFRRIGESRTVDKGGPNGSDCRIFRPWTTFATSSFSK